MKMTTKLWKPMLAAKPDPDNLDAELARLPFPALFSPKLDGIRATVQGGVLYARSLKPIPNKAMQALWGRKELEGLDGEIIVGPPAAEDCFNRTTSVVMSRGKAAEDAVFWVFDWFGPQPYAARYDRLIAKCGGFTCEEHVLSVRHDRIKTAEKLAAYEAQLTAKGYEGVMRRDPDGLYKQGRSTLREGGLVAVKRTVDAEAVVVGVYEQEENTNEKALNELGKMKRSGHKAGKVGKGTLGGFTVAPMKCDCTNCARRLSVLVNCERKFSIGTGVGLTEVVRAKLWARRKDLVGKVVKFRYQRVGTKDAPRQPIFLGFRDGMDL
jgi:DNA ligase 1